MTTFITIIGISLLIIFHELGHYLAARFAGMRVIKFSIGFGPTLLKHQIGETIWQLAVIPFGGYVQVQGMGPEEEQQNDGRGYNDKPRWQRAIMLAAGPVTNWIIAALCLTILAIAVGLRDYSNPTTELGVVESEMAAGKAGIQAGDRITEINGVVVNDWESLVQEVRKYPEKTVPFVYIRQGKSFTVAVTPKASSNGEYGIIGIQPAAKLVTYGFFDGIAAGIVATAKLTANQASLLWGVITGSQEGHLSGIPGIVKTLSAQAKRSLTQFFETLATLSIVLFILNLAPIPSLDGSRLVFLGIESLRRKPNNNLVEGWVHGIGLILLLGLILVISVRDLL
ncbi:MAG: site-2 protease family protein [Deltaproteobacteria bacterium]|nr:site-2 protease family protein [Deltaproteobacteria bacterium]